MDEAAKERVESSRKSRNYVTCYLHDGDLRVLEGICERLGVGKSHAIRSALIAYSGVVTHLVRDKT